MQNSGTARRPLRPGAGQVRLRLGAIGVSPLGVQAVGTVDAVGADVVGFAPGDRVTTRVPGSRPGFPSIVSERDLIGIPKDMTMDAAAGVLPSALVARTIVKQLHTVGKGDRVVVAKDESGVDRFVAAWALHLGATVLEETALSPSLRRATDVVVSQSDFHLARKSRHGHGLAQIAAADVFQAVRDGAFVDVGISRQPLADAARVHSDVSASRTNGPVVLVPATAEPAP